MMSIGRVEVHVSIGRGSSSGLRWTGWKTGWQMEVNSGGKEGARSEQARRAGRGRDQGVGGDRGLKILEPVLAVGTGGVRRQRACVVDPNRCGLPLSGNPCGGIGQSREGLKFEACRESHVAVMLPMQMSRVSFSVCPYFAVPAVVCCSCPFLFLILMKRWGARDLGVTVHLAHGMVARWWAANAAKSGVQHEFPEE